MEEEIMSKKVSLIALAALCCCSVSAVASDVVGAPAMERSQAEFRSIQDVAGHWTVNYATGKVTPGTLPLRADVVYDNTTNDTGSAYAYFPDDPNYYVGDSLWMVGDGLLDALGFSIYNADTSGGPLTRVDATITFYDPFDVVLGTVALNDLVVDPALQPGYVAFFEVTDLQGLGIELPQACMYTLAFSDAQGGATALGQAIYDPPTVGESADMFYEGPLDVSLGQHNLYFNSDPIANFYFAVSVENPAQLQILWDAGPTHTVIRDSDGVETWLGYLSGDYNDPGYTERWAAMPFRIEQSGATITEMVLWWWTSSPDYTADHANYIIWNRTGLARPESFDELFSQGLLGPYEDGGRDYRAKPYADWVPFHTHAVDIPIPVGDYWLTIYAEGDGGGTLGRALAWESGCSYVPEDLEREFFWRSQAFPDPGFQEYTAPYSPGPEMTDPNDRWNLAFVLRGTIQACPGDVDGDGDTDLTDLAALLTAYGSSTGQPNYNPNADFEPDGDVDLTDLAFLLSDYGC
jgi:hypothetical protein